MAPGLSEPEHDGRKRRHGDERREHPGGDEAAGDELQPARQNRPGERDETTLADRQHPPVEAREPDYPEDPAGDGRLEANELGLADAAFPARRHLAGLPTRAALVDREPSLPLPPVRERPLGVLERRRREHGLHEDQVRIPPRPAHASASSTWSACRSGFTRRMIFATLPSASITNVERS